MYVRHPNAIKKDIEQIDDEKLSLQLHLRNLKYNYKTSCSGNRNFVDKFRDIWDIWEDIRGDTKIDSSFLQEYTDYYNKYTNCNKNKLSDHCHKTTVDCFGNKIGEGSFGEVYTSKCTDPELLVKLGVEPDTIFVLKELKKYDEYSIEMFKNELKIALEFRKITENANKADLFLKIYGCYVYNNRFALVTEYLKGKTLKNVPHQEILDNIDNIAKDLLEAVKFMNEHGFRHRDIKPANIVYDKKIKLIDYGLMCNEPMNCSSFSGTDLYTASVVDEYYYLYQDVIAAIITIINIYTGKLLYDRVNLLRKLVKSKDRSITFYDFIEEKDQHQKINNKTPVNLKMSKSVRRTIDQLLDLKVKFGKKYYNSVRDLFA